MSDTMERVREMKETSPHKGGPSLMQFALALEKYYPDEAGWKDRRGRLSHHAGLTIACLGLSGETGEVVDLVKKHMESGKPIDRAKLAYELGDVLHYLVRVALMAGINPDTIAPDHLNKLHTRFGDGYSDSKLAAQRDKVREEFDPNLAQIEWRKSRKQSEGLDV